MHVQGAESIARISAQNRVSRFVHVSHLNASEDSSSAFYRTKAAGEEGVKRAFPDATIVRPGSMYGHEDKLLNSMACEYDDQCVISVYSSDLVPSTPVYAILWKLNFGETRFAPVHVSGPR